MGKRLDLTGQKFNLLMSVRFDSIDKDGHALWLFKCDCGNEKILRATAVKCGRIKSCGCLQTCENLIGQKFNKLIANKIDSTKKGKVYWLCQCDCGNVCIVSAYSLKSGHTKSCGCYRKIVSYKAMKIRHNEINAFGENNPNWNPNLTKEDRENCKIRNRNPKYKIWHQKVFKRDNYTCQCCGQYSGNLEAHHVYSYHSHKKLRYVTSNGVTLCKRCHKEFHSIYGIKNNTRKQLNKFKKSKNYD